MLFISVCSGEDFGTVAPKAAAISRAAHTWPPVRDGAITLSALQLRLLFTGMDWSQIVARVAPILAEGNVGGSVESLAKRPRGSVLFAHGVRRRSLSGHQIAAMVGVSRYTVAEYLRRAAVVGITWPVPAVLDDVALERKLFTPPFTPAEALRPQPDWPRIHAELRKPGVTLLLCGRSIGPGNWMGMATAGSATSTRPGAVVCRRPCGIPTRPASGCSSTMPGKRRR